MLVDLRLKQFFEDNFTFRSILKVFLFIWLFVTAMLF